MKRYSTNELRGNTTHILDECLKKPVIIEMRRKPTRDDKVRPDVVMMSVKEYDRLIQGANKAKHDLLLALGFERGEKGDYVIPTKVGFAICPTIEHAIKYAYETGMI